MKRLNIALLGMCCAVKGATGPVATPASWPIFRGDAGLTGVSPAHIPATPVLRWTFDAGDKFLASPVIAEGRVFAADVGGTVHALGLTDGERVWSRRIDAGIEAGAYLAASPALREGFAAIGHYHGEVLGIDLAAAAVQWRFAPRDEGRPPVFYAAPTLTATRVLAGARNGRLYALSRRTGEVVWQFAARGDIDGAPVVTGDWVLFGSRDGHLYRLRFSDGQADWSYRIGSPVLTTPAVVTDWIVVGANDGSLYAFGAAP